MSSGAILPIHALLLIAAFRIPWVRFTELDVFGSIPRLVSKCYVLLTQFAKLGLRVYLVSES